MSNIILSILALLVLAVFAGIIYALVYAIFMFIFSGGNEEKIKKARNSIRYAILGFILTLTILFAIPAFLKFIKVPGYQYYTGANILSTAKNWFIRIIEVFNSKSPETTDGTYQL